MNCQSFPAVIRGQSEEKRLLTWMQDLVPTRNIEDLDCDLADGVALCGLMQALVPGTCPRHDLLPPDQPAGNIRLASRLASTFLGVTQVRPRTAADPVTDLRAITLKGG